MTSLGWAFASKKKAMRELSIFAAASEAPSRECLVANGRAWSFAEVAARVSGAIDVLRSRGVASGDRVAFAPQADFASAVWLYALFELGCPALLVHPRLTERERALVLGSAAPVATIDDDPPRGPSSVPAIDCIPEDRTLAIVYTSGSRGAPRGALLSRRAFVASEAAHAANLGWTSEDRWLLGMPPAHVGGLSILTRCLIARRSLVLQGGPFDPAQTIRTMEHEDVTLFSVVPTMLHRLLECESPKWRPSRMLRAVLVGGAPLPDPLRKRAVSSGVPILSTYGCTEACSQVATQTLAQVGLPGCGAPLPGIHVRIDGDEIQVRGPTLMQGYLGAERAEEPWTEDGWLRTGDFGAFASDGQLVVRGRIDDIIVTGGENVAPQEIEAWLHGLPGVTAACVFPIEDLEWGQRVVAAIVADARTYEPETMRARMKAELAAHKRPRALALVEELPLNRSGKVDRLKLRALVEAKLRPI
jgi:O-succinylbenzoic acid--CoA ligase